MHDHIKDNYQNTVLGFNFDIPYNLREYSLTSNLLSIDEIYKDQSFFDNSKFYLLFDPLDEDNNCIDNVHEVIENFVKDFAHHHLDRFASNIGG